MTVEEWAAHNNLTVVRSHDRFVIVSDLTAQHDGMIPAVAVYRDHPAHKQQAIQMFEQAKHGSPHQG